MTRRPHHAAADRRRRAGAWLLAIFALGQLLALAHHAFEAHAVCVADGAVVHAGEGVEDGHLSEGGLCAHAGHAEEGAEHHFAPPVDPEEHHDACSVPTPRDPRSTALQVATPALPIAPGATVDARIALRTQAHEGAIPLVLLAPKQSPPVRI